ncbi:MAG TPA: ABC transporter permease [Terracidiphilus sp.]|jgi:putative ABC transport system permease protein
MSILEGFKIALQSLWANKMRSILTLLGVVIGIASVITVVTLTNGAKQFVTAKINSYGAAIITVSKMPQTFMTMQEYLEYQKRKDITNDDYRAIATECKSCLSVGAERTTSGAIIYGSHSTTDTQIRGWTWTMPPINNLDIAEGRSFTEAEDDHSAHVAVVGADIVNNILGAGDPLGKEIRVDGEPYTVIGVGEAKGNLFGSSLDNWVTIPLNNFLNRYGSNVSMDVYVDAGGGGSVMEAVSDELRTIMRIRHHLSPSTPDNFNVDSSATFTDMLGKILNSFGAVVASIATISLVVGGIVIMNIMLVTVTERTREIGVRKALGANRRDIMLQFLIESATISLVGGLIGVIAGISVAKGITLAIAFPSEVQFWSILVSLFVASAVGLFFGIYPAYKASALDPIVALRAEL